MVCYSCFVVLHIALILINNGEGTLINTPSGPIRGIEEISLTSKSVVAFYGIPYAKTPVNELRFSPPEEIEPWNEEFEATKKTDPCYGPRDFFATEQRFVYNKTEDCLKLHIWVSKSRPENCSVMVYIHGGGFLQGNPLHYYFLGTTLAAEENIIVVSMNYRLHVLGFLYFGIPDAPGNVGLMDQQIALTWINRNIASFGGNPNDVTIFGMSAGGASVGYHLLSEGSAGLFNRAILMSGAPNSPVNFKTKEEIYDYSLHLAIEVGCYSTNLTKIVNCLKGIPPDVLINWNKDKNISVKTDSIGPTFDGSFIKDYPRNILKDFPANPVDIMIGVTADEGSFLMRREQPDIKSFPNASINRDEFERIFNRIFSDRSEKIKKIVYNNYLPNSEDTIVLRDRMIDLLSDYYANCPADEFAEFISTKTNNRVYRYVVDFIFKIGLFPEWMGTVHGTDTYLHLGYATHGPPDFTEKEVELSKKVMKLWANFAKTGNPNSDLNCTLWPLSTITEKEYLLISGEQKACKKFREKECSLFKEVWKRYS